VNNAQGLAFIASTYWLRFPAILKGWFERVFSYGDAYALTPVGWGGGSQRSSAINTWEVPMTRIINAWGLRYPGVKRVEHVCFYGVPVVDDETRRSYLDDPTN
jgi:NAD(P)H dehydrogenase (quinone)